MRTHPRGESPQSKSGESKQGQAASKGDNERNEAGTEGDKPGEASKGSSEQGEASKASNQKGDASKGSNEAAKSTKAGSKPDAPSATPPKPGSDATQLALAEAKTNQKAIADELQKMLDGLSEFETYRGVVKDAQELLKQHEQTMKQTDEAAAKPETMGKPLDALTPEQKADLGNLASRQSQVGKGLQNLLERMGEMAGRLDESDPLASSAMREAAEKTRQQGTTGKLGEAADQLEKNQMGQARSRQEQARDELRDLVDAIQNRRERELARLVKELKNAEAELAKTRARQAQNLKKTREAQKNPNAKERARAVEAAGQGTGRDPEGPEAATAKAGQAGRRSRRAGRANRERQDGPRSRATSTTIRVTRPARNKKRPWPILKTPRTSSRKPAATPRSNWPMEQLARMGDRLKSLAERQEKIVSETNSYEAMRQKNDGKLTIAQRAGVKGLGQVQTGIKEETADLIENLEGAPVFALTLRRASKSMEERRQAAGRAQDRHADRASRQGRLRSIQAAHRIAQGRCGGRARRWWRRRWWRRRRCRERRQWRRHPRDRPAQDAQVAPARDQRADRSP